MIKPRRPIERSISEAIIGQSFFKFTDYHFTNIPLSIISYRRYSVNRYTTDPHDHLFKAQERQTRRTRGERHVRHNPDNFTCLIKTNTPNYRLSVFSFHRPILNGSCGSVCLDSQSKVDRAYRRSIGRLNISWNYDRRIGAIFGCSDMRLHSISHHDAGKFWISQLFEWQWKRAIADDRRSIDRSIISILIITFLIRTIRDVKTTSQPISSGWEHEWEGIVAYEWDELCAELRGARKSQKPGNLKTWRKRRILARNNHLERTFKS
jgi:hypothetical protein